MNEIQTHGKEPTRIRYVRGMKSRAFDALRHKKLVETTAEDFLAVLKNKQRSVGHYLRRLHNLALNLGWLPVPDSHAALFRRLREHSQKRDRLQLDFGLLSVFAKQNCAACYFHPIRLWFERMKNGKRATERIELGEYIVADPEICHGKPTFKGTRIMVWQILDELAHGMTPDEIVKAWGGRVPRAAIAESVQLARHSLLKDSGELRRPKEALARA
jgi:uncharacterized protein (DUF433 family)